MSERPRWNFLDLIVMLSGTAFCLLVGVEDGWRTGLELWLVAALAYCLGRTVVNEPPRHPPANAESSPQPDQQPDDDDRQHRQHPRREGPETG
jgi:hypothetical protein